MFDVIDEAIIDSDIERVSKAIIDVYDGKASWWMPYLSSRILKGTSSSDAGALSKVTIHNIFPISFITETVQFTSEKSLKVKYIKGAFVGQGEWTLEKVGSATRIRFHWQTKPSLFPLKLIALFYPIGKGHSKVMQKGFALLGKHLGEGG